MTVLDDAISARETELARIAAMSSDMRAAVVRAMGKKTPGESGYTLLRPAPGNAGIIARAVDVYNTSACELKAEISGDKVKIPFFVLPTSLRSLDIVGAHMCAYNETRISARMLMEYLAEEVTAKRIHPDKLRAGLPMNLNYSDVPEPLWRRFYYDTDAKTRAKQHNASDLESLTTAAFSEFGLEVTYKNSRIVRYIG